jgi:hypothetical protein
MKTIGQMIGKDMGEREKETEQEGKLGKETDRER